MFSVSLVWLRRRFGKWVNLDILYPYIFMITPLVFLYNLNSEYLNLDDLFVPLVITVCFGLVVINVIERFTKEVSMRNVLSWTFFFAVFMYRHLILNVIQIFHLREDAYYNPTFSIIWIAFFISLGYCVFTSKKTIVSIINRVLKYMTVILFTVPFIGILAGLVTQCSARQGDFLINNNYTMSLREGLNSPDVYFIILDRYGSDESLKNYYGYDNEPFLKQLETRGFMVVRNSYANYIKTAHSLSSTLNMQYLTEFAKQTGENNSDMTPLYSLLETNEVIKRFKANGYRYLHFGSWWEPTRENKFADENYSGAFMPEFSSNYFMSTVFYPIATKMGIYDLRREQWNRAKSKLKRVSQVPLDPRNTFTFAHFLVPHPPYVFDADGSFLDVRTVVERTRRDNYINQIIFINSEILKLIDTIQGLSPDAVIVLQADEGPFPLRYEKDVYEFKWNNATNDELHEKLGILNAYYFPAIPKEEMPVILTPVNTFRHFFNYYYQQDFEILDDRNYAYESKSRPYRLIDVTDIVNLK